MMGVDLEEDLRRKMIELNLASSRLLQSSQTGYIHLSYDSEVQRDTIPLLENFCFVLALLRSRLADNILEGKSLLEKLLIFEVEGNFPIYLHEFPLCKDRALGLDLLPICHWILTDFRVAIGEILTCHLEMLIGRILSHAYRMHAERPLAKAAEFRLKSYFEPHAVPDWTPSTPEEWASALISWQMSNSRGFILAQLLEKALQKWHPQLGVYLGPQHHMRMEPEVTLFDLLMGHYYGHYSRRALEARRVHLLSSLIYPFDVSEIMTLSSSLMCQVIAPSSTQPCTLYWGSLDQLHSLSFDAQKAHYIIDERDNLIELSIALPPRILQEGEEAIEAAFFMNLHPTHQIQVNGAKATTFQLGQLIELYSARPQSVNFGDKILSPGDCVERDAISLSASERECSCQGSKDVEKNSHFVAGRSISSEDRKFQLEMTIQEGEGRFFGHISRGNRSNQKAKNLKFETFDWQIALRTIRRSEHCVIRIRITF